jgi:tRNA G37 N-methylase TrmD
LSKREWELVDERCKQLHEARKLSLEEDEKDDDDDGGGGGGMLMGSLGWWSSSEIWELK